MRRVVKLYSKFENLTEEKKKRIIDVCVEEFSKYSYRDASTNSIVKKAGISKGILFHYFGNKRRLYLYVLDYIIDFFTEKFYKMMDDLPADFFERIMKTGLIKLKMAHEYPSMYKILLDAITHAPDDLKEEVQARYEKMYKESMPMLLKDIDTSKFRKDIDRNKAIELIMLALEGVSNKYLNIFKNMPADRIWTEMENVLKDYNEYIEILKGGVYGSGA